MTKTSVLLADDHEMIRYGLRLMLENEADISVCGEAANGREAVKLSGELKPDVLILDILMPELNGADAVPQIKQVAPQTEILIFSSMESEQTVHETLKAGARGYLLKTSANRHLIPAIRTLARHNPFFSSKISQMVFEGYLASSASNETHTGLRLTIREREIVQSLAEGKTNKDIAGVLGISIKTAETHRAAIMRKLELDTFSELVRYAIRNQIIQA